MNILGFIQAQAEGFATEVEAQIPVVEVKMNILELATKGGWIMVPILLLLLVSVAIFIERIMVINKVSQKDITFMSRINDYLHEGNVEAASKLCKRNDTPYSRMVEKGLQRIGHPASDILFAIENQGAIEISKLEKGFFWVATTAAVAPMLGFFGTVTGMVKAFFAMANAGSNVDITNLSSGIYEALVTTVAGLFVGIPALFLYNFLQAKLNVVTTKMDSQIMDFMDIVNETEVAKVSEHSRGFVTMQQPAFVVPKPESRPVRQSRELTEDDE
ncbi:MotA/TolQ/ExbB proton channel family protein [Candidatus Symbiothrix dinenymphae]|uniref:MotA/TolQ/ExbB proton channel family protein n=1 Tax=Candidatus Symbiothrix dinenymphae TaxID=467085 RepID=UPI0006C291BF|nr:MotA/TolQ/ExbB proton channel family protein [Candidatus Symbiothrix dinenymphae]GAP72236.1 MotA/TolQ/ExbB proton channel family [Candidatus Symbiothrix dinenymphae]